MAATKRRANHTGDHTVDLGVMPWPRELCRGLRGRAANLGFSCELRDYAVNPGVDYKLGSSAGNPESCCELKGHAADPGVGRILKGHAVKFYTYLWKSSPLKLREGIGDK